MLLRINKELSRAKERVGIKRKLEAMLAEAQCHLQEQKHRRSTISQLLKSKQAQLAKLEGVSLKSLVFTIIGTKSMRLDEENREYLSAKLKHAEAVEAVEFAQMEFDRLKQSLIEFRDADSEFERLVEEKHLLLVETRDPSAEVLGSLAERLADLRAAKLGLQDAIQTGMAAIESLDNARAELRCAEEVWISEEAGGAFKATQAEISRVNAASQHVRIAQRLLCKLQEELADKSLIIHAAVHIDMFSTFAKSFFDGPIWDWLVKSKIQAALSACGTVSAAVSALLAECHRQFDEVQRSIDSVTEQRRQFIEKA